MKYTYAYKTSDGIRHEGSINASSREEVFGELRRRDIKAIKVVAADGSKANGETRFVTRKRIVFAALATGLLVGAVIAVVVPAIKHDFERIGRYKPGMAEKMAALQRAAKDVLADHAERMAASGIKVLKDYEEIYADTNSTRYAKAIRLGYNELNVSRQKVRGLFRPLYDLFPPGYINERTDAQGIYAETMDEIDRSEAHLVQDENAYRLLCANRGKWTVEDGKVVFSDESIAKEFAFYQHGLSPAEMRWSRDFKH